MRFKIGNKVRVVNPHSGGNFEDGDVVEIVQIGFEDLNENCYGAISPYDNIMWFLQEDEVAPVTNADNVRSMTDKELASFLMSDWFTKCVCKNCEGEYDRCGDYDFCETKIFEWLTKEVE